MIKCKSLIISSSVNSIEDCTFYRYGSLKQIAIPPSVISIGDFAFSECISLTQISIPPSVISIGDFAFKDCKSLIYILIPPSIKSIKKSTFDRCVELKQITIPSSVKTIQECAFNCCRSLKQVIFEFPSSLTSIENNAFNHCSSLIQISIPPSVTLIDEYAFANCLKLKQITIPSSVKSICDCAFFNCCSLKQVEFEKPSSLKYIESSAFLYCWLLNKKSIPSYERSIEYEYYRKSIKHVRKFKREFNSFLETKTCFFLYIFLSTICQLLGYYMFENMIDKFGPWFSHGHKSGKLVYQLLESYSLSFNFMFLGLITWALISYIRTKLFNSNILLLFGYLAKFVFIISYLITIWAGYRVSLYTMRIDTLNGKPIKCLIYVIDIYEGAKIWADNQSDVIKKGLNVWHSDMMRKLYDKNGAVTEYYCNKIGLPFVMISTSALISLFVLLLSLNRRDNKNKDIIT